MESIFKIVVFLVIAFFALIGGSMAFGYGCGACNRVDDISDTPCTPILSNGNVNPNYHRMMFRCESRCLNRGVAILDTKTCVCECKK